MIDKILNYNKEILIALGLVILYFITRIILLGNLPIFTDEAIYVRWTQIAASDANWRFISLTDGKQPMFVWAAMPLVKLVADPLVAVRLVSVISGFLSLVGLFLLSYELFKNRWISLLTSFIYIVFPFAMVYDRMALYDSMVGAFAIWAVYFSILLVRKIRLDVSYTLGFILAGGMLTKSNANFSILMLPFTLLLFNFKKFKFSNLAKWGLLALFSVIIAEVFYNSLRLSPFFHIIAEKNTIFVYPVSEWVKHPFTFFFGNLKGLLGWLFTYLTPAFILAIILSFFSKTFIKEKILLVLYFLAPFLADALFGKVIFPRHIFFTSLYLLPLIALGIYQVILFVNKYLDKQKLNIKYIVDVLIILLFVIYPLKVSLDFIFTPQNAAIADSDKNQYISDWPSGGGVKESITFFNDQAKNGKILVATEGTFGLMPGALDIYLNTNPNIKTVGIWPIAEFPKELSEAAKTTPVFYIFYQPCPSCQYPGDAPDEYPLQLVKKIKKSNNVYYSIYKVKNQ